MGRDVRPNAAPLGNACNGCVAEVVADVDVRVRVLGLSVGDSRERARHARQRSAHGRDWLPSPGNERFNEVAHVEDVEADLQALNVAERERLRESRIEADHGRGTPPGY